MKAPRWSRAQYQAYCEKHGTVPAPPARGKKGRLPRGKNKAEAGFEVWFKHQHPSLTLLYEPIKLRIDETCWFLPDYWCPETVTFYEVKGPYIYPDALMKFKAARAIHTWAKWQMWQCRDGAWRQIRKLPGETLEA